MTAYLLYNGSATYFLVASLTFNKESVGKPSLNKGFKSLEVDPKPSDLFMVRVKMG